MAVVFLLFLLFVSGGFGVKRLTRDLQDVELFVLIVGCFGGIS